MLKFKNKLSTRVALPMLAMGFGMACVILVAVWNMQVRLHKQESLEKAQIVADALEIGAQTFANVQELIEFAQAFGSKSASLQSLSLVDLQAGKVVAATQEAWVGLNIRSVPQVNAVLQEKIWIDKGSDLEGFALPVTVNNPSITRIHAKELVAVVMVDTKGLSEVQNDALMFMVGIVVVGAALVFFGVVRLLQRVILRPIRSIHKAVHSKAGSESAFTKIRLPILFPDEIGQLGDVIKRAFKQLHDAGEELLVLSNAMNGISNEIYVLDAKSLEIIDVNPAGLSNLGYEREELIGKHAEVSAPSLRDEKVRRELSELLLASSQVNYAYDHIRRDGTSYVFEFKGTIVDSSRGPLIIVFGADITERQKQEEALRQSQQRMKLAMEGSNDGLFDYDISSSQIYISEFVQDWLGVNTDKIDLNQFFGMIDDADTEQVTDAMRRAVQDKVPFNVEFRLPENKTRKLTWLQVRGQVVEENGIATRLSGFASDVTRRKVAESLLNTAVSRLGSVLNNISDGILTLSSSGEVCTINVAGENIFAASTAQVVNRPLTQLIDLPADVSSWDEIADGEIREFTAFREQNEFVAEVSVSQLDAVADEKFTVVVRDISKRKEYEAQLHDAMLEAQAATQAKGEFLATMSHEIRTPMNGVLGMTQLLLDMQLNNEQRDTAELIFKSGESLLTIINDILDYSKIEAGKIELEEVAFSLPTAISEVMGLLGTLARNKQLDLYVDYDSTLARGFVGDVGRIRQVLLNLVGNAIKFTETGHVLVEVEAAIDGLILRVKDSGLGISAEQQSRLFESFTQADTSTTRKFGGTGLGLAISRQLIELMGGEIGVESELGEGAEFWFKLNLPQCDEPEQNLISNTDKLNNKRLLAVDDNAVGLQVAQKMAEGLGIRADATDDPHLVIDMMHNALHAGDPYDVVALDYNMPGMDGLELTQLIRGDAKLKSTKILLLTSSDISTPAEVDGYALKPIMLDRFSHMLITALYGGELLTTAHAPKETEGQIQFDRLRVLLAEDNMVNQRVAVKMFEKMGLRVDVAANGVEAVGMWQQFPYDMIFMDCQMPEMDGFQATQKIRELEQLQESSGGVRTPIIAMTANAMTSDRDQCLAIGMDDYVSKPVKFELLEEVVSRWAAHSENKPGNESTSQPRV